MKVAHLRLVADNSRPHVHRKSLDWRAIGRAIAGVAAGVYAVAVAPFRLVAMIGRFLVGLGTGVVRGFFRLVLACIGLAFVVYPVCMVLFTIVHGALHHAGH